MLHKVFNYLNRHIKLISRALFLLSIVFAALYFSKVLSEIDFSFTQLVNLLIVLPVIWIWLIINGNNYYLMLKDIDVEINRKQAIQIWIKSNLAIYSPGKIGLLLTRMSYHKSLNNDLEKITFIIFNESLITILSSILVVLITSLFVLNTNVVLPMYSFFLLAALILGFMHPKTIKKAQKIYASVRKIPIKNYQLSFKTMFTVIVFNFLKWSLWGFAAWWIVKDMTGIEVVEIPYLLLTYSTASLLGLLAFFAPSGLGVMEIYTSELYSFIMPSAIAATFSILIRIWKILGELSIFAFIRMLN